MEKEAADAYAAQLQLEHEASLAEKEQIRLAQIAAELDAKWAKEAEEARLAQIKADKEDSERAAAAKALAEAK